MAKTFAVIDGNSLMHRAFHAVPPTMNAPDGTPTNAVFGFFSMFLKFVDEAKPDAVVCAFDCGKPAFRVEALQQYKAQRPPMDPDLKVQFALVEELLTSMNIPIVKQQGWEGDDILGTVAAQNEVLGNKTLLLTGDKDACQLASELTHIVSMKKGVTDIQIMGPAEVEEKYGVSPALIPDYLGLMGDSSDNIPGVPGIGPKTATKLLQAYGSMEGLYENLDKLKGKQLENVRDNKDAAFVSRQVATISRDADIDLDLETVSFPSYSAEAVTDSFSKIAMRAHLPKVLTLIHETAVEPKLELQYKNIVYAKDAEAFVQSALAENQLLGVAITNKKAETLFDDDKLLIAFSNGEKTAYFEDELALHAFAQVVKEGCFVCADLKSALQLLYPADSKLPTLVSESDLLKQQGNDLSVAAYVSDSSAGKYSLSDLVSRYLQGTLEEADNDAEALSLEASACVSLFSLLNSKLQKSDNCYAYENIDLPLVAVLAIIERNGAAIDVSELQKLGIYAQEKLEELRKNIYELAGEEFNIDSPKQLSRILFEVLELPPSKKTKTGYSTDAQVLSDLSHQHELPKFVLEHRELAKIKSTYIDALPPLRAEDGLIHTSFNATVTTTGRLSSSEPNLQNIPVRTEFGRNIRRCFVPLEKDHVFVSADYSQIELRLLAHLSQDENLIAAFNSGADFHAMTAARIFGVELEEVNPEMRSRAKAVNFGIVYGQQAFGLAQSLHISFAEAKSMIDRYFEAHPGVKAYLNQTIKDASSFGYAQTMYGRKRHIPELKQNNKVQRGFGERTAMNHPMQGSAADIIKLAMRTMQERLLEEGLKSRIMIQVHDELDLSVPQDELEHVCALCKEVMEQVATLRVPLEVSVSFGQTWAEAH